MTSCILYINHQRIQEKASLIRDALIYEISDQSLGVILIGSRFSPTVYDISSHRFLDPTIVSLWVPSSFHKGSSLKSNQKVFGRSKTFVAQLHLQAYLARLVMIVACRVHSCVRLMITFLLWQFHSTFQHLKTAQRENNSIIRSTSF